MGSWNEKCEVWGSVNAGESVVTCLDLHSTPSSLHAWSTLGSAGAVYGEGFKEKAEKLTECMESRSISAYKE